MAMSDNEIDRLRSMREMASALRTHGRIVRSEKTLYKYAKQGVEGPDGKAVRLHCVRMNGIRLTCLRWFDEFLSQLEDYGSCVP